MEIRQIKMRGQVFEKMINEKSKSVRNYGMHTYGKEGLLETS